MAPAAHLETEDRGAVRVLTLRRPDKLNALNAALLEGLTAALVDADGDDGVGALVLAGGPRAFCAGADLAETRALRGDAQIAAHADRMAGLLRTLARLSKPTLAAVEGYALGGGCGLALACDGLVASTAATFGYPEVARGVLPALVVPGLVRRLGPGRALDLLVTGRHLTAAEMDRLGLVAALVEPGRALEAAVARARTYAATDRRLVAEIKALVAASADLPLDAALDRAREANLRARRQRAREVADG
ncbi:MAG: enoyl-CoA hydratase/isomerase family protein [Hyphomicrobiales bacterium]|nr:enoyl-CoA hydratase/isomerase family protein [Hyphomicrobiales bacterium]MCP5370599.1 enoyl-CoA hydratase/isomerase family protein [Hyphomicrobiales bacterium]